MGFGKGGDKKELEGNHQEGAARIKIKITLNIQT